MADYEYVHGQAFAKQNVFRTITIAFQPYIPFSQAFVMDIANVPFTAGRSDPSYFHFAPRQAPEEEETDKMGKYPWKQSGGRLDSYLGMGGGRLAAMSVNPIRINKVLQKARNLQGEASADVMGEKMKNLFDSGDFAGIEKGPTARQGYNPRSVRLMHELETEGLTSLFEMQASESGKQWTGWDLGIGGERDPLRSGLNELGGFDIMLEHQRSLNEYLESTLDIDIRKEGLHSMEISRAQASGQLTASKMFTNLDFIARDKASVTREWNVHIGDRFDRLNKEFGDRYEATLQRIMDDAGGINVAGLDPVEEYITADPHVAASRLITSGIPTPLAGLNQGLGVRDRRLNATMREMLDRLRKDRLIAAIRGGTKSAPHLWSGPLTDKFYGAVLIYPTEDNREITFTQRQDIGGTPQVTSVTRTFRVPQMNASRIWVIPAEHGEILNDYAMWMKNQGYITEAQRVDGLLEAKQFAANEAMLILNRLGVAGTWFAATGRAYTDAVLQMRAAVVMTRGLTSTSLASSLHQQIRDYYESGAMKENVKNWYEQLMEESNTLTKAWFDAQEMGKGPVVGKPNKMGTTRSSEYVLGDELGNPRKHYLGVWSDAMEEKTWRGPAEGSKGDVGYNFAIAPFVTSRRAFVASSASSISPTMAKSLRRNR